MYVYTYISPFFYQGVNIHCIEMMTGPDGLLTYKAANMCLDYFEKFPAIQSAFYRYLVSSLVDKNAEESGTDLENIWCIYVRHFHGNLFYF